MSMSDPLGPTMHARATLRLPGEHVLWAAYGGRHGFDVPGLTQDGEREPSLLAKGASGLGKVASSVGGGIVDFAAEAVLGPGEDRTRRTSRPAPPTVLAYGPTADSMAPCLLRLVDSDLSHIWALTSARLVLLAPGPRLSTSPPDSAKPTNSLFAKEEWAKVGKETARSLTSDNADKFVLAGVASKPGGYEVRFEIPRARIKGFSVMHGRLGSENSLQMSLVDGSGFDFMFTTSQEGVTYMLGLTNGTPA